MKELDLAVFLAVFEECAEVDGRLADEARGHPAFGAEGREGFFEEWAPAEVLQRHVAASYRNLPMTKARKWKE